MKRRGFTLVEILVATTLALLMLGAVITIFGNVSQSIAESRSMLEMAEQIRLASTRLQQDLAGVTVTMNPPRDPANNEGYFECIEGPATAAGGVAVNTENGGLPDSTVGDFDDILMFTTRSTGQPFKGKCGATTIQSDVAEVAWFVRGRTLHRRVLLVAPAAFTSQPQAGYYASYDVSGHLNGATVVPNTLGDLTRRECRFGHNPPTPYLCNWYWTTGAAPQYPTLPTLSECSPPGLMTLLPVGPLPNIAGLDFWTNASGHRLTDTAIGAGNRVADDVILNNVIGFDVKVWDPTAGVGGTGDYVDLGYNTGPGSRFSGFGNPPLNGSANAPRVYDTYSTTMFNANSADGLDDAPGNGVVDDEAERGNPPPYPYPLRGIQVKIRVFEPDSRQIREVTVVQDFLPQ